MPQPRFPEYLRLHLEDGDAATALPASFNGIAELFPQIAGWKLRISRRDSTESIHFQAVPADCVAGDAPLTACDRKLAEQFAGCLTRLWSEMSSIEEALLRREAELAAGIPVKQLSDEDQHLAARLEAVLKGGADAIDCQAAGVYLLDDATTELKLRSSWGLPRRKLLEPARPLRDAFADLEAMLGNAVVLEDTRQLPAWKCPEEFASAVCVPISTASTPLGTLWFFCDRTRDFSPQETNIAEVIAGRVATELERQVLLHETVQARQWTRQEETVAQRQEAYLPQVPLDLEGWDIAGETRLAEKFGGNFHDWCVLNDGTPALAICDADGPGLAAYQTSLLLYAAYQSHSAYPHDAAQMLDRMNQTIWTGSAGDQFASFLYGQLDPDNGTFRWSTAGDLVALSIRLTKCEILASEAPAIGSHPDSRFRNSSRRLDHGDLLVILSGGVWKNLSGLDRKQALSKIAKCLKQHRDRSAEAIIGYLRDWLGAQDYPRLSHDETILVVKRLPS